MHSSVSSLVWSTTNLRFLFPLFVSEFAEKKPEVVMRALVLRHQSSRAQRACDSALFVQQCDLWVEGGVRGLSRLQVTATGSRAKASASSSSRVVSFHVGEPISVLSASGEHMESVLRFNANLRKKKCNTTRRCTVKQSHHLHRRPIVNAKYGQSTNN